MAAITNEKRLYDAIRENRDEVVLTFPEGATAGYWGFYGVGSDTYNTRFPSVNGEPPFISGISGMMIDQMSNVDRCRMFLLDPTLGVGEVSNYIPFDGVLDIRNPILFNVNRGYGTLAHGVGLHRIAFAVSDTNYTDTYMRCDNGVISATPSFVSASQAPQLKVRLFLRGIPGQVPLFRPSKTYNFTETPGVVASSAYSCGGRRRMHGIVDPFTDGPPPASICASFRITALMNYHSTGTNAYMTEEQIYPVGGGSVVVDAAGVAGLTKDFFEASIPAGAVMFRTYTSKLSGAGTSLHFSIVLED